jgi:hypothetical protein
MSIANLFYPNNDVLYCGSINTSGGSIDSPNITVNNITEYTSGNGVNLNGVLFDDNGIETFPLTLGKKIVLYNGSSPFPPNLFQYYGFAVQANALELHVDKTTTNFNYYAGTSATTGNLLLTVPGTGGIILPNITPSPTASSLSFYNELSVALAFTGPWAGPVIGTFHITRIGNVITMQLTAGMVAAFATGAVITSTTALPVGYRPYQPVNQIVIVSNGASPSGDIPGTLAINSTGFMTFYYGITGLSPTGVTFSGGSPTVYVFSCTYIAT